MDDLIAKRSGLTLITDPERLKEIDAEFARFSAKIEETNLALERLQKGPPFIASEALVEALPAERWSGLTASEAERLLAKEIEAQGSYYARLVVRSSRFAARCLRKILRKLPYQ